MQALWTRSLSAKLAGSILLVLLVTLGFNLWITQRRVNSQAEQAFSERLRTMTDVALGSRISNTEGGHAWEVAARYAKTQGYEFRTPAKSPLNPQDTLNAFDQRAFSEFESNSALTQYVERTQSAGRDVMLFARPVVVTKECQECHEWQATPAAETARRQVPALFSIAAPMDELAGTQRANAGILAGAALVTLLLTTGTVLLVLRRVVLRPLKSILHLANRMAANDLTGRLETSSGDEIGQTGDALNHALGQMSGLIQSVAENADRVAGASEKLSALSRQITSDSEETTSQATTVTTETEEVNRNLQTMATGAEQMGATIRDISLNATEAARVAGEAVAKAESTNATVSKLGSSTAEIGEVIKVITSVAEQTNLLALNATIEAARAGEAGKGFAVVANEVKELAKQTGKATQEIGHKIAAIQTDAHGAVEVIAAIRGIITRINDISGTIATAVEQQGASTQTISQSLTEAAGSSNAIARNIHGVAQVSQGTSSRAHESLAAADQLARMSTQLRDLVEQFKVGAAAHGNGNPRI